MLHKTLVALVAATALGCVPVATTAFAAGHPGGGGGHGGGGHGGGGHAMGGHGGGHAMAGHARGGHGARYGGGYYGGGGPIYDSCYGYGPGYGCPGYGIPLVGGVINGILGGY